MKKVLSALISVILVVLTVVPCSYANYNSDYIGRTEKASMSTADFIRGIERINNVIRSLTGINLFPKSSIDMNFQNGVALELCNYMRDNSGLDMIALCENFPLNTDNLEFFYSITNTDTAELRNVIHTARRKCDDTHRATLSTILYFFENYLSIIESIDVYTVPAGDDGTVQVALTLTRLDGSTETMYADIFFSPDGLAYGADGHGVLGLGFECSVYDLLIYATKDCWMQDFGFCLFYDIFCYATPFFNYMTRRFKFDYDGKEWMVQIWKGNYVSANGSEVGIYCRDKGKFGSYYDCYDGVMNMTLGLSYKDETIYELNGEHWWLNGFKLSKTLYKPSEMKMSFSIELLSDEMANALANSINRHYRHDVSCEVNGNIVSAVW